MENQATDKKILLLCQPCTEDSSGIPNRIRQLQAVIISLGLDCQVESAETVEQVGALLQIDHPDLVWSTVYRLRTTDGSYRNSHQVIFEFGYPYVGSNPATLDLVLAKSCLKERWKTAGVLTPEWVVITNEQDLSLLQGWNHFPAIIKPNEEGNSRGLSQDSVVENFESASKYLQRNWLAFGAEIVEQFLGDDPELHEYTVAILGNHPDRLLLPAEIILESHSSKRVITTEDKDLHRTRAIPIEDSSICRQVCDFASFAANVADVEDYARMDIILSGGHLYALEINGQPMLPDRWFDTCCLSGGLSRTGYVKFILESAIRKWQLRDLPLKTEVVSQ
jgi:D-alanine-D-alanine ligase